MRKKEVNKGGRSMRWKMGGKGLQGWQGGRHQFLEMGLGGGGDRFSL